MNRIKVPSGSKQSLETVFDNLQDFVEENITDRIGVLFSDFGVAMGRSIGVSDDDFKIILDSARTGFTLNSGKAISDDGEHFDFAGETRKAAITSFSLSPTTYYLVKMSYTWVGSDAVAAQNAFMYNAAGTTPYSTQYTKKNDTYLIEMVAVTGTISSIIAALDSDEFALGLVYVTAANKFDTSAWTFDSNTAINGVIDLRHQNRLLLDIDNMDDSKVLLKDRDSTGDYAIDGKVEVNDDFYIDTDKFYVDQSTGRIAAGTSAPQRLLHLKATSPSMVIHDSDASTLATTYGLITFYKGTETSFTDWGDRAAEIELTTGSLNINNRTEGDVNIITNERDETASTFTPHYLTFTKDGYLGVNDSTPSYNLDVAGTLRATGAATLDSTLVVTGAATLSASLSVGTTAAVTGAVTLADDLTVTNAFKVDNSENQVLICSDTTATIDGDLHIRNSTGVHLKLDSPAVSPIKSTSPYIEFSSGASNPETFIIGLDAANNYFRIDDNSNFDANHVVIDNTGRVAINTDSSLIEQFTVNGSIETRGTTHHKALKMKIEGAGLKEYDLVVGTIPEGIVGDADDVGTGKFGIYDATQDTYRLTITRTGNVGININNATYKLHVNGTSRFTEAALFDSSLTADSATITAGTITALTAADLSVTSSFTGNSAYFSGDLSVNSLKFPENSSDTYVDAGYKAGLTSGGAMTIGAATSLVHPTGNNDTLRVHENLRLFSDSGSKFTFAGDTLVSGMSLVYTNSTDQLAVNSTNGTHLIFYENNGSPATYIENLHAKIMEVTDVSVVTTEFTAPSIVTDNFTVTNHLSVGNNLANFSAPVLMTSLTADDATFGDTSAYDMTLSGTLHVSGLAYFGETAESGQRIELNGNSGTLSFYDASNDLRIYMDDDIYGSYPGIKFLAGGWFESYIDALNYSRLGAGSLSSYTDSIVNPNTFSSLYNGSSASTAVYGTIVSLGTDNVQRAAGKFYSTSALAISQETPIGIECKGTSASSLSTTCYGIFADGDHNGTGDGIGIFARGSAASGNAWAGYFSSGNVKIENDLHHGTATSDKIGFFGTTPVAQVAAYTPTNVSTDRSFDCDTVAVAELADVVATLIEDLQSYGLLG